MLLNLLARSEGIVGRVVVGCPDGVPLAGRVVPLADRALTFSEALAAGTAAIDSVPITVVERIEPRDFDIRIVIGPGPAVPDTLRVHGERWWGGFSRGAIPGTASSPLPFGPYVAACLAMGEVFKYVRLREYFPVDSVFYSTWTMSVAEEPVDDELWTGPDGVDGASVSAALAGVGAVGSTWVHALWATPDLTGTVLLADSDPYGVDTTNLNRCPIFGRASVGHPKASEAVRACEDASVRFIPHDGPIGTAGERPPTVVSAVDTNRSRQAIQELYPVRLLSGSTYDLRAEVLRCDPVAGTACIHCFNPVEAEGESDVEVRRRFLAMDESKRRGVADDLSLSMDDAIAWAVEGVCGYAGDRLAAHLRPTVDGPAAFAVGFVSAMAGTMLAALTVQESLTSGSLRGATCRALFQFFDPLFHLHRPRLLARQPTCPMCDPLSPAVEIWRRRFLTF